MEICITTPRGSQRRRVAGQGREGEQKGGRGWLSVEKAGAHTSIRGTTPRSQGSFVISQSYCHPSTTLRSLLQPPLFLLPPSTAPPSLSRATFCVPAMLRCRVFMSSSPGVKTAGSRQVRCTPKERFAGFYLISQIQIRRTGRALLCGGYSFAPTSSNIAD